MQSAKSSGTPRALRPFNTARTLVLMLSATLLLTACQTIRSSDDREAQCAAWRSILYSLKDTAGTIQQVRVHNRVGQNLGCWKAGPVQKAMAIAPAPKKVVAVAPPKAKPALPVPPPRPIEVSERPIIRVIPGPLPGPAVGIDVMPRLPVAVPVAEPAEPKPLCRFERWRGDSWYHLKPCPK